MEKNANELIEQLIKAKGEGSEEAAQALKEIQELVERKIQEKKNV